MTSPSLETVVPMPLAASARSSSSSVLHCGLTALTSAAMRSVWLACSPASVAVLASRAPLDSAARGCAASAASCTFTSVSSFTLSGETGSASSVFATRSICKRVITSANSGATSCTRSRSPGANRMNPLPSASVSAVTSMPSFRQSAANRSASADSPKLRTTSSGCASGAGATSTSVPCPFPLARAASCASSLRWKSRSRIHSRKAMPAARPIALRRESPISSPKSCAISFSFRGLCRGTFSPLSDNIIIN